MSSEASINSALRDVKIIRNAHIPFIVIGNKLDLAPDQKSENSETNSENVEKIETLTSPNFIQCSAKEENVEIRKAFSHLYYQGTRYIFDHFSIKNYSADFRVDSQEIQKVKTFVKICRIKFKL